MPKPVLTKPKVSTTKKTPLPVASATPSGKSSAPQLAESKRASAAFAPLLAAAKPTARVAKDAEAKGRRVLETQELFSRGTPRDRQAAHYKRVPNAQQDAPAPAASIRAVARLAAASRFMGGGHAVTSVAAPRSTATIGERGAAGVASQKFIGPQRFYGPVAPD